MSVREFQCPRQQLDDMSERPRRPSGPGGTNEMTSRPYDIMVPPDASECDTVTGVVHYRSDLSIGCMRRTHGRTH
jgi:hypothetical protein